MEERTPICPTALRYCDIRYDLPFMVINVKGEIEKRGVFLDKPFDHVGLDSITSVMAKVHIDNLEKQRNQDIYLADYGITKYESGIWHRSRFCILDTLEGYREYSLWLENGGDKILRQFEHIAECIRDGRNVSRIKMAEAVLSTNFPKK